jgi:HAD superfamily hydrolase (TIGR01509 family)
MKIPPPLAAVVFDLDGLIVNSEDVYDQADVELLRRRGKVYEATLREQMMGRPTEESLQILIEHHALEDTPAALEDERSLLRDKLLDSLLEPMPGLLSLLTALREAGIPAAIATSGRPTYVEHVLGRLKLHSWFQFFVTAENVARGKPHPEIYELAASRLGIAPNRTMVLEDSANGVRAGVAAGAFTVAVPNRHTMGHDFTGVQFVADTLADPRIRAALRIQ